ncbi:MAG: ABC transporter permease subunit [Eubacteriales bacterium]|nr:ABC transporter permease subunit [Eubacteriales bacterium]
MRQGAVRKMKKGSFTKQLPFLLMTLPGLLYLLINNYVPMFGIVIAFKDIDFAKGILGSEWVGLENFKFLFRTNDAFVMTRNTICYNLVFILLGTAFSVAVAIMLNELISQRGKKIYQTVILLPQLISIIIVAYIVYAFLNPESGMVNGLLSAMGLEEISWYSEKKYWPFILTFVNLWKSVGYSSIVYLAAISGIDQSIYEAAKVDGAGRFRQIFQLTIPLLKPTIIVLILMSVGRIMYSDFGLFYQVTMNSGALYEYTNTIDTYIYRALLQLNDISMSSAASVYQSLVGFVLIMAVNMIVKKIDQENALF